MLIRVCLMKHSAAIFPYPDLDLVFVEGGSFLMGEGTEINEVSLSSFHIGRYPVTQRLWQAIKANNPSRFVGERRPVENVSWLEVVEWVKQLNAEPAVRKAVTQLEPAGVVFRLPTEAEWEYAARGGRRSKGFRFAGSDRLEEVGWYRENSYGETKPVGLKLANELGLHDMSGNVWEWCKDRCSSEYYKKCRDEGRSVDPFGSESGDSYMLRGGSSFGNAVRCRTADRYNGPPHHRDKYGGFRLVIPCQSVRWVAKAFQ